MFLHETGPKAGRQEQAAEHKKNLFPSRICFRSVSQLDGEVLYYVTATD